MNNNCNNCKHKCDKFYIDKSNTKDVLISHDNVLSDLLVFFEYLAPNTSSALSPSVKSEKCNLILSEMLKNMKNGKDYIFCESAEDFLSEYNLDDMNAFSKCKRFVCSVKRNQNKLTSLLRHIRNSIAHGRFYIIKTGNYYKILLEDKKKSGN